MSEPQTPWRSLRVAAWLGWQLESNWTSPFLFFVYVIAKPVSASLILVGMYYAVQSATGGTVPAAFLPFVYVSNAVYGLVGAVMFGMSNVVITDREHYRMLKYVYISPVHLEAYCVGRATAKAGQVALGTLITLGVGMAAFPGVRAALLGHSTDWGWLLAYAVLGAALLLSLGLILTALMLHLDRQAWFLSEGLAGVLYLLCGVVYPVGALPGWMQAVALALPPTYWLEGVRRSLLGTPAGLPPSPLDGWSHAQLALVLTLTTAVLVVLARWAFRASERRAWRLGKLEQTTGS